MSTVAIDLLAEARRHGVDLVPTPVGTIKASAPKPPPPDLWARLKAHRAELIAALACTDQVPTTAESGGLARPVRGAHRSLVSRQVALA
jgi:hypothetical protein